MTCPDLCTAEKCRELEARIGELERALKLLEASFEAHTQQNIPEAHEYFPYVQVDLRILDNTMGVFVAVDERHGFDQIDLPNSEHVESNLKLSGLFESDKLYLTVADGESQDTAVIDIPHDRPDDYRPERLRIHHDIYEGTLATVVELDNLQSNVATVDLPTINYLQVDAAIDSGTLAVNVTIDDLNDIATVDLPVFEPFVVFDIFPTANNTFVFQVSVNGVSDSDTLSIAIPDMNCDELFNKLEQCCDDIKSEIDNSRRIITAEIDDAENNLINQIDAAQFTLTNDIKTVEDYVTVDISGTIANGTCEIIKDDDGEPLPIKQTVDLSIENYSGAGLVGINNALKLIEAKLTTILSNTCAAIEPDYEVDLSEFAKNCNIDLPLREEYSTDALWFNAVKSAIVGFGSGATLKLLSKSLRFTPGSPVTFAVTATASYIYKHLLDQTFSSSEISYNDICQKLDELEDSDVVSLVASPKYVTNIDGKVLVLHFVTQDNYPKRQAGSSYRSIQIPGAKEEYDWIDDFLDLRWLSGNQYAELQLEGYVAKVSGWFADKDAANSYFDAVLELTTAREVNRNLPDHSNPQTAIAANIWRPYRAFIESVDEGGRAICHAKYVPVEPTDNGNRAL